MTGINLDKMDKKDNGGSSPTKGKKKGMMGKYSVMPRDDDDRQFLRQQSMTTVDPIHVSLANIKNNINNVTMQEIKEADEREPPSPRTK